jgi:hypothetical protein
LFSTLPLWSPQSEATPAWLSQCAFRSCGDRLRNPDDDMVLEAAVNGRADAIVTFNHRDFAPAAEKF